MSDTDKQTIDKNALITAQQKHLVIIGIACGQRREQDLPPLLRDVLSGGHLEVGQLWEVARQATIYSGRTFGTHFYALASEAASKFARAKAQNLVQPRPLPEPAELSHGQHNPDGMHARELVSGKSRNEKTLADVDWFNRGWLHYTTEVYGDTWSRGILSLPQLSVLTIGILCGASRMEEFELHFRNALMRTGVSVRQLRDLLSIIAVECGAGTGRDCFVIARRVMREESFDISTLRD